MRAWALCRTLTLRSLNAALSTTFHAIKIYHHHLPLLTPPNPYHRHTTDIPGRFHMWKGGNLTLIDLEPSDSGVFECVVRSAVMTLMASTRLLVETGIRYAPYDVVVVNSTWRSVTVEWKPAFRPGMRLQHVIW